MAFATSTGAQLHQQLTAGLGSRRPLRQRQGSNSSFLARRAVGAVFSMSVTPTSSAAPTPKKVAIIGAGVAGLQTARALQKAGIPFELFERDDDLGGVWKSNYAGFGLQVRWSWYEFPEYPWPEDIKAAGKAQGIGYPTGPLVQEYIQAYANRFGLKQHIRFKTPLQKVERNGDGTWTLTSASGAKFDGFDYLVSSTGVYNKPFVPETSGTSTFKGKQLTAPEFTAAEAAKGLDVVVVGGGKSALDIAAAAARWAKSVTVIQRKVHWPLAPLIGGIIPYEFAAYSRLAAFSPAFYITGGIAKALHIIFTPVKWLVWRVVEVLLRVQFGLWGPLSPSEKIERDVFYGGQIFPEKSFFDLVGKKKITALKGVEVESLGQRTVQTTGGQSLNADLVIWATGYQKTYDWLDADTKRRLDLESDGLWLYRNVIPAGVSGLAFIGSEATTYNNIATSGLQAEWLAHVLTGRVTLPAETDQAKDVQKLKAWRRSFIPDTPQRAGKYQLFGNSYHDQLLRDIGVNPFLRLLPTLGLAELVWPTTGGDYRSLVAPGKASWWGPEEGKVQQRTGGERQQQKQAAPVAR